MAETAQEPAHTVNEALNRFTLINGAGSEDNNTACAMTALAWVAGEAWTDRPPCAHRILSTWVINANDHADTTVEERAELVRAGEAGVLDTWWVPSEVLLGCWAKAQGERRVEKVLDVVRRVAEWKASPSKPRADLQGADLRGAYLQGAYLRDADLRDADLRDAYLRDADLRDADLRDADLRDADLRDAYLRGADLRGADLRDAYLRGADLRDADLQDAYLRDADLQDAYLQDADLQGAYLRDADLQGADLRDADLRDADLRGADLRDADLRGAYLRDADLRGAYLRDAYRPTWLPAAWQVNPTWPHAIERAPAEVAS